MKGSVIYFTSGKRLKVPYEFMESLVAAMNKGASEFQTYTLKGERQFMINLKQVTHII